MSEPFLIAARLPMTRAGFDGWLASPLVAPAALGGWDRMYTGWYWSSKTAEPPDKPDAPTVKAWLAKRVAAASNGDSVCCLVRHADDALVYYDGELMGAAPGWPERSLAIVRAAAPYVSGPGYALYWSETSGQLVDSAIAVCAIDAVGSEFVDKPALKKRRASIKSVLAALEPAGELFGVYIGELTSPEDSSPNLMLPKDPRFVDPAISGSTATAKPAKPKPSAKPKRKPRK